MIIALAKLNYPSYTPALWQGTLVYWGVIVITIIVNTTASKILPTLESFILILHIVGFFAVLIPLICVSISNSLKRAACADGSAAGPRKGISKRGLHSLCKWRRLA